VHRGRFAMAQRRQPAASNDPRRCPGGSRKRRGDHDSGGALDHESAAKWISPKAPLKVFITTSLFSAEAHDYVSRIEKKIILIDGPRLASLLFDHGVGVRTKETYEVKEVDEEYFLED
jgi:restriction system protein